MRKGVTCWAIAALVCAVFSATALAQAPGTEVIPVHVSKQIQEVDGRQTGIFAPDGHLWIAVAEPGPVIGPTTLLDVAFPSGRVVLSRHLDVGVAALIVGPDGNIWFAGRPEKGPVLVGFVTPNGAVHVNAFHHCCVEGLAAGPDGNVWLTLEDFDPMLVRISTQGRVSIFKEHSFFSTWFSGLVPGPGGTLWTNVNVPGDDLAQVLMNGQMRFSRIPLHPETLDAAGHLRGWNNDVQLVGLSGRSRSVFPQLANGSDAYFNTPAAMTLGADGQVWFTAYANDQLYPSAPASPPVLGVASRTSPGTMQTWSSAFVTEGNTAVGSTIPGDNGLFPGPDGRLYALGYPTQEFNDKPTAATAGEVPMWHLFAVTLPSHPTIKPASIHIDNTQRRGQSLAVTLSCTGQSGRFCSGEISLTGTNRQIITRSTYALGPGLQATHTISVKDPSRVETVNVTSLDAISHHAETRRTTLTG